MALTKKQLAALDSCPCLKELKDWFIAIDNEDEPAPIKKYHFISYGESACTTELGRGTVKTTGVTTSGYIQVKVTSNSTDQSFVGQKFYVVDTAEPDGETVYQLYAGAGTGATGMYVKISNTAFPE
ncbi:hypothetical protein [Methanobrevibacter sp.]|uniref:hypothetical protein n=1 Tax=Methanobrevibacter sp. TaxID=66852 RepID=UPI00388DC4AA